MAHTLEVKEYKQIIDSEKKVLVYFTAKWCGPCKRITSPLFSKMLEKNEKKNHNIKLMKIDVDESQDLAKWLKINSLPTILVYFNGKCVDILESADNEKMKQMYKGLVRF